MNKDRLISIVVPIYNGETYVEKMIDSLISQTYSNFEVLLVNDFSTDNSLEIIKNKVKNDTRFKILNAEHKLGTAVRGQEYALPLCSGEYYFFLSQDDFLDDNFFEKCIFKSIKTGADVVLPNCIRYYGNKSEFHGKYPQNGDYESELSPRQAFELSLTWQIHGFSLRKMWLVRKVGILGTYYNSCEYYGRILFLEANKIAFANTNFYYRLNNPDAITQNLKYFHVDILKTDVMLLKKYIEERYDRRNCIERYKSLFGGWISWWFKAVKNQFLFVENGYVFRTLMNVLFDLLILIPQLVYMKEYR